ncbi:MAG: hypothetical protein MJY50_00930, partial [Bacteroidales bacterium]|nr:hypothetical protein [Bacteroidales bacterium]
TAISAAGTAFSDQLANHNDQREGRTAISVCRPYVIGTLVSREERNARIDARLKARLEAGMVDEIRRLLDSGVPAQTLISYGLEYKFVTLYVLGEMGYDQMYLKLSTAIHQFAKRQMTWFRGMQRSGISIHWVDPGEGSKRIIQTS